MCVEGEPDTTLHILEMMEVFLSDSVAGEIMQKALQDGARHGVRVCLPSLIKEEFIHCQFLINLNYLGMLDLT